MSFTVRGLYCYICNGYRDEDCGYHTPDIKYLQRCPVGRNQCFFSHRNNYFVRNCTDPDFCSFYDFYMDDCCLCKSNGCNVGRCIQPNEDGIQFKISTSNTNRGQKFLVLYLLASSTLVYSFFTDKCTNFYFTH